MFKLIFATLLALATVLMVFGEGDGRRLDPASTQDASTATDAAALPGEATQAAAGIIDKPVVEQTPSRENRFPGPELRPSPEYAGLTPAPPAGNLAEALTDTLYITGNTVNFRDGPSTSNGIVGKLSRGQMVVAVGERSGDWVEIRDGDGRTGFMSSQFLSASRP